MKIPYLFKARALLVTALLSVAVSVAAESPSVLLQKGIYAEEIERNLDSAIKIYEQIAAEAATSRAVVAQAQYRLAVCYEKKGDKEQAIRLLNELVQQATADPAVIQKVRKALSELGEKLSPAVAVRKIKLPVPAEWFWPVSQDGRYLPCQTNALIVCDLIDGKSWTVKAGPFTRQEQPDGVYVSPDGRSIAYDFAFAAIYVARIDGTETRKLVEKSQADEVISLDGWSTDGSQLLFDVSSKANPKAAFKDFTVDVKTGAKHQREHHRQGTPSLSGQYVAQRQSSYPRKLTITDVESGREEIVVERDAARVIGWADGDSKLLFSKHGSDGIALWSIEVRDGKPQGQPQLLRSNFGDVWPLGITHDGSIYYSTPPFKSGAKDLWVMEGFLPRKRTVGADSISTMEIPAEDLIAPDHSILDRKHGLASSIPTGWVIKDAVRRSTGGSFIAFDPTPKISGASWVTIAYGPTTPWENFLSVFPLKGLGPKPTTTAEAEAWLRGFAKSMEDQRTARLDPNYKNRPGSILSHQVNGQPALSWVADLTRSNTKRSECFTVVLGEKVIASVWFEAPTPNIDEMRPALDQLIETLRVP
jgi:hypothetical protein